MVCLTLGLISMLTPRYFFFCLFETDIDGSCWLNFWVGSFLNTDVLSTFYFQCFNGTFKLSHITLIAITLMWHSATSGESIRYPATLQMAIGPIRGELWICPVPYRSSNPLPVSHMLLTGCGFFTTSSLRRCSTKLWSRLGSNHVNFLSKLR